MAHLRGDRLAALHGPNRRKHQGLWWRTNILADAFRKAMDTPEWKKFAQDQYLDPESYMGPEKFGAWIASEVETMRKFMKTFGMTK